MKKQNQQDGKAANRIEFGHVDADERRLEICIARTLTGQLALSPVMLSGLLDAFKVANSAQYYRPDHRLSFRAFWAGFDLQAQCVSLLLNYFLHEPS